MSTPGIKRTFEPGIYVLTEAVINPILDRRTRHDWRTTTHMFATTDEFIVEYDESYALGDATIPPAVELRLKRARFSHHTVRIWLTEDEPRQDKLLHDRNYRLSWALAPYLQRVGDFKKPLNKAEQMVAMADDLETIKAEAKKLLEFRRSYGCGYYDEEEWIEGCKSLEKLVGMPEVE